MERAHAPGKIRRNAPDAIPVSVIGRLAVDRDHSGRGLGADILADALRRIAAASRTIGIAAVLVHAKNEAAKRFYLARAEFIEFPADSRVLFLPIETLVAGFELIAGTALDLLKRPYRYRAPASAAKRPGSPSQTIRPCSST